MTGTWLTTGSSVIVAIVVSRLLLANSAAVWRSQSAIMARCRTESSVSVMLLPGMAIRGV